MTHSLILVNSTSHAIRAEKILKKAGFPAKLVPIPREISSDCGVAIRIPSETVERCRELLTENKALFEQILEVKK